MRPISVRSSAKSPRRRKASFLERPSRDQLLTVALVGGTVIALYLCYRVALPFLPALAWAAALAVMAYPLHDWIRQR